MSAEVSDRRQHETSEPVLDAEASHAVEVLAVVRDEDQTARECVGGDHRVLDTDRDTLVEEHGRERP